ncbi:hypothetical protein ILUMI_11034 [Ignelater luminosus]|uniref:Lipase domain-containing protein n=1 Tax=Ignelater luminosus TaxID=2038154 RepID=A0A8K0GDL4_IGNLU|nr:hypothetical protein ILUMI_11034 [Ignelater luminosus]
MKLLVLLLLSASFILEVFSRDNTTVGELPPGIAAELLSLLTNKTIALTGGCGEVEEDDVSLLLFNRTNSDEPIILNSTNPIEINPDKKVIILIHGWISNPDTFIPEMKDSYLERYDCNLVMVNWKKLALKLYTTSICYVPKVAEFVANFLCLLNEQFKIALEDVHLVGHSLGGQMSGFIGQHTKRICNKAIGRITGMDPAGPFYQGLPRFQRLDNSDANFVDVLHTNAGILGYWGKCGHADFYVNCGTFQLGCPDFLFTLESVKDLPVSLVTCHHSRSVEYMEESVSVLNSFEAKSCPNCPILCAGGLLRTAEIIMGESIDKELASGGYTLTTNLVSPYGAGILETLKVIPKKISLPNIF